MDSIPSIRLPVNVSISIAVASLEQPFHPLFLTGAGCVTAAAARTHLHRSSRHDLPRKMLTPLSLSLSELRFYEVNIRPLKNESPQHNNKVTKL